MRIIGVLITTDPGQVQQISKQLTFVIKSTMAACRPRWQKKSSKRSMGSCRGKNEIELIRAIAALTSIYWNDIDRKAHQNGKKLFHVIWCAKAHDGIKWYFNNIRMRHAIPVKYLSLLGSGASPNGVLHAQLNKHLRNNPEVYSTTLDIQLMLFSHGKMLSHYLVMRNPQVRQYEPCELLAAAGCKALFDEESWVKWKPLFYIKNEGYMAAVIIK